jgi:hypothetical protein
LRKRRNRELLTGRRLSTAAAALIPAWTKVLRGPEGMKEGGRGAVREALGAAGGFRARAKR